MRYWKLILLVGLTVLAAVQFPKVYAAPITVTVTPSSEVVGEYSTATYTISLTAPAFPGENYLLSIPGTSGSSALFSPNPVTVPAAGATSTLTINVGASGLCPGPYTFTVTATHTGPSPGADTGTSASTSLVVAQTSPALRATVTTDKQAYRLGDKVTILMNVNKPAIARLTIQPPTGAPQIIDFSGGIYGSESRTLTADTVGRWNLFFEARVCSETDTSQASFDVSPNTYDVSIVLSGIPSQVSVNIQIDGQPQGAMAGSEIKKLSFKIDTSHVITVDQYVTGDTGVRYYAADNTWNFATSATHTFEYETQYLLTVATDPNGIAQVTGGGWYKAGSTVQTNQAPDKLTGEAGTQYVFKGWEVDGAPQQGNPITLTMDKPHSAVAKYQTQYQLIVDSPNGLGNPKGSDYYDAGSTAQFSVTSPVGFLIQQVFVSWQGDYSGTSPQGSITMDKPKHVIAVWTTSYTQLYIVLAAIAVIVIVAAFLLWRRRRAAAPPSLKPTPPIPPEAEEGPPPTEGPSETSSETPMETRPEAPAETSTGSAKCASCGADVPVGQAFCHNCGGKMDSSS